MNDEIFLPTADDFLKYKEYIPVYRGPWWVQTNGKHYDLTLYVYYDNGGQCLDDYGDYSNSQLFAIRPLTKADGNPGERVIKYNFPWVCIGDGLAIAEVPIGLGPYNLCYSDYESSDVRSYIRNWLRNRNEV